MNKVIKIEDYPCGSGKTTRMIENFKEDRKVPCHPTFVV